MQEGERRAKAASGVELRLGELMQESRAGWRRRGERGGISESQRFRRRWNGGGGEVKYAWHPMVCASETVGRLVLSSLSLIAVAAAISLDGTIPLQVFQLSGNVTVRQATVSPVKNPCRPCAATAGVAEALQKLNQGKRSIILMLKKMPDKGLIATEELQLWE
ncbi:hypothetical protein Tsubulata_017811 [Turnera subulata]|uniref:Uncharacterized protein n=1 Tax=Turnera subulata TaxID=218843 RepID=A0A9Q0IZ67_9ROSI|nr:hypothetical protein Tsubulata_017811 [Turnera subulata]